MTSGTNYTVVATYVGDINYPTATGTASVTAYTVTLTDVALGNGNGRIQSGDTITATFSGPVALGTFCSSWSNLVTNQTVNDGDVTVVNGGNNNPDSITISSPSCAPNEGFGGVTKLPHASVSGAPSANFSGSTIAWNAATFTLTVTLGSLQPSFGGTLGSPAAGSPQYTAGFLVPGSPFDIQPPGNGF